MPCEKDLTHHYFEETARFEKKKLLVLRKRPEVKESRWYLEARKGKRKDTPPEPPERM